MSASPAISFVASTHTARDLSAVSPKSTVRKCWSITNRPPRLPRFSARKYQALAAQVEDRFDLLDESGLARPLGGYRALTRGSRRPILSMDHRVKPGGDEVKELAM